MMEREYVFTRHVRDLVRGDVTRQEVEAPWQKLRDALTSEMRHRGLFSVAPACLGIYGFAAWTEEAIDELTRDCYTAVFLRRLPSLAAQLERKSNVEGLVFNNIRHYFHAVQRKHDPLGFRTFTALRAAVTTALERGSLLTAEGDGEVRNETVLEVPSVIQTGSGRPIVGGRELEPLVHRWTDEWLPDLVTARGAALDPVVEGMAERLARLADHGITAFRFRDLAKLLKDRVRLRWTSLFEREHAVPEADAELEALSRAVPPATAFEEREAFEKLVTCVENTLETIPVPPRTRIYLHRLWVFLWSHAAREDGALPSRRRLAEQLEIPRARFMELYATLGRTVEMCRECLSGQPPAPQPRPARGEKMEAAR